MKLKTEIYFIYYVIHLFICIPKLLAFKKIQFGRLCLNV